MITLLLAIPPFDFDRSFFLEINMVWAVASFHRASIVFIEQSGFDLASSRCALRYFASGVVILEDSLPSFFEIRCSLPIGFRVEGVSTSTKIRCFDLLQFVCKSVVLLQVTFWLHELRRRYTPRRSHDTDLDSYRLSLGRVAATPAMLTWKPRDMGVHVANDLAILHLRYSRSWHNIHTSSFHALPANVNFCERIGLVGQSSLLKMKWADHRFSLLF